MTDAPEVPIEFKSRHGQISERMKQHATTKIGKLARYQDWLSRIEVVADHAHDKPDIELIAHLRKGGPLISRDWSTSFSATIDLLVDKMDTLLRKQKEKIVDRKTQAGKTDAGIPGSESNEPPEETYEDIVRKGLRQ